jgi:hypothetical protein
MLLLESDPKPAGFGKITPSSNLHGSGTPGMIAKGA